MVVFGFRVYAVDAGDLAPLGMPKLVSLVLLGCMGNCINSIHHMEFIGKSALNPESENQPHAA